MAINDTKKEAQAQADKDLKAKAKRIRNMEKDLNKYFKHLSKDFSAVYHATGNVIDLNESYEDELKSLLKKHYREIQGDFASQIRTGIDNEATSQGYEPITEQKNAFDNKITMALGALVLVKATTIAPKIVKTTQDTIKQLTNDYITQQALNGVNVSKEQVAKEVGKKIRTWGRQHAPIVATTETQTMAEKSKHVEAIEVEKVITSYDSNANGRKTWFTHGDERVRKSHQVLDGVTLPFSEKFVTGMGNALLFAGDIENSQIGDVINCRCMTVYRYTAQTVNIVINHIYRRKVKK